jgi:hypothetical protein
MALTKPRAHQLFDIDYKQSVRALTDINITLAGSAPDTVDGVELAVKDRVLVIGQNTASENGLYYVTELGTGTNGTWQRSQDADETGELLAGAIVMVTEGVVFADTQWKLVTDNPIEIGSTALTWEQNSAFAFGNIFANGTPVLADTVGDTLNLTPGTNIEIVGNAESKSVTIGVTGISLNSISNGTSNVNVVSSSGNVTVGIDGVSNVAVFSSTGLAVDGSITGNGSQLSGINAFSTVAVATQNSIVADSIADTLTLAAGSGIAIITDADTDTITIATIGSGDSIFAAGGSMGTIEEEITAEEDQGLITENIVESYDLGTIVLGGLIYPDQFVLPSFTVSELGNVAADPAGQMVFCINDAGGAVPAFSDGVDWRRVTDRQIVS